MDSLREVFSGVSNDESVRIIPDEELDARETRSMSEHTGMAPGKAYVHGLHHGPGRRSWLAVNYKTYRSRDLLAVFPCKI